VKKKGILLLGVFLVAFSGFVAGASEMRALPVESVVESRCGQTSNATVSVEEFNISLEGAEVDTVNCSRLDDYTYPEFEPPQLPEPGYDLDEEGYYGLLTVFLMVPVAGSLFLYSRGYRHTLGATAVSTALSVLSPGIWSVLGQSRSAVIVPAALAVSGIAHLYVTEDKREKMYVGGIYMIALVAVSVSHGLSLVAYAVHH
jgi:hypothetical protein